jgi:hypothetical protein
MGPRRVPPWRGDDVVVVLDVVVIVVMVAMVAFALAALDQRGAPPRRLVPPEPTTERLTFGSP